MVIYYKVYDRCGGLIEWTLTDIELPKENHVTKRKFRPANDRYILK